MKLDFSILWFDDQPDDQAEAANGIKARLAREGFDLKVKWIPELKDPAARLRDLHAQDNYDLILMDWHLKGGASGAELAKLARKSFRYTEIVFYSAASPRDLREAIFQQGVDGVYCFNRDNVVVETMGVIDTMIKKVLDLNHMRGLVMAAVADLDYAINECLTTWHTRIDDAAQKALVQKIISKIQEVAEANIRQAAKLSESSFDDIMKHRAFSTALKHMILQGELSRLSEQTAAIRLLERFSTYQTEVVEPRNILGHERPVREKGKLIFPGRMLTFDDAQMRDLRKNLISHQVNLMDLLALISQWSPPTQ